MATTKMTKVTNSYENIQKKNISQVIVTTVENSKKPHT